MKNLIEHLNNYINEAREEIYSVAFIDFTDNEGLPVTVKIYVPKENTKDFEKYLEKELDNTVVHASGLTNNFEL